MPPIYEAMSAPSERTASEEVNYFPKRQAVACRYCHEKKVRCNPLFTLLAADLLAHT